MMEPTVRTVGVLDKSMALLDAVASSSGPCRLGDLVAATGVWEHMVSALMLFWRNHPEESAAAMVARAHRVLAAMAGHTLDRVRG